MSRFLADDDPTVQISFKPSDAVACLKDVPINKTLAVSQIDWIQRFIQFQSTLGWLKSPPSTYGLPPVDLVGGLQKIQSNAKSGKYSNQFDFEVDIDTLINSASDGHLGFTPFLVGAFSLQTSVSLVSISDDGHALPKVYFIRTLSLWVLNE
jgi:hypothetical protein